MKGQKIIIIVHETHDCFGYHYEYDSAFDDVMDAQEYIRKPGNETLHMKHDILQ